MLVGRAGALDRTGVGEEAWVAIALAIVAVSFGPVFQADTSVGTTWVLLAWHVVAAVAIVAGMRLTTRKTARDTSDMS